MLENIGSKVRFFRELRGYSQEDMARLLEVTLKTYGNLERDNNKTIDIEKLNKVAKLLQVEVADFLDSPNKSMVVAQNGNGDNNSHSLNIYGLAAKDKDFVAALDKSQQEITFLKEKIKDLEKIIALLERR